MPNYQKGKIYKITTQQNDKIYIGSTCKSLTNRFADHKCKYNLWLRDNNKKSTTAFELLKYSDCKIELMEDYPCESCKQLTNREGYYIKLHRDAIVNKQILTRTNKEWRDEHKEDKSAYDKTYYENNKDAIIEQHREYVKANSEVIAVKRRAYVDANYDTVRGKDNEAKRKKYLCEVCDKEISVGNKSKHILTRNHLINIENNYKRELEEDDEANEADEADEPDCEAFEDMTV